MRRRIRWNLLRRFAARLSGSKQEYGFYVASVKYPMPFWWSREIGSFCLLIFTARGTASGTAAAGIRCKDEAYGNRITSK